MAALAMLLSAQHCVVAGEISKSGNGVDRASLAARSGPRGKTLFTLVPTETSGVTAENRYDDPAMWGDRASELEIGAIGTGVAIGDFDGDGRPDIFVVNKTSSCRLYRNLGDFHFEDVTEKAGIADFGDAAKIWKNGVSFADVNNDGRLDIYVCRSGAANLLYLNQGDGTFKESAHAAGLDVKDASVMAAFADYDRDGWLDVFIQTNLLDPTGHPEGQRDYLFHNNGDGTFSDVTDRAGVSPRPSHGNSAVWWDFDGDGWPDLYVANDFAASDALYRNNHDGTFTDVITQLAPHVPYSAMGSDVGDVDNDGRLDFMVADMAATSVTADQRTMAETRARQRDLPDNSTEIPQYQRNALFLNTGVGRFLEVAQLAGLGATDWTWSLRWEDLDDDGRLDLFVTNGMHREIHNVDILARRGAAENEQLKMRLMKASPVFEQKHLAFRNLGQLAFSNVSSEWGVDQTGVGFGAALGDLDGDGDLDIVYGNYDAAPTILRNDNEHGHRIIIALRGTRSNRFGVGAKIRLESASGVQVHELTLARGYMSSSEPIVHFGLGDDAEIKRMTVTWPSGAVQTLEDLSADQRLTITEPEEKNATVSNLNSKGENLPALFKEITDLTKLGIVAREEIFDEFAQQKLLPWRLNRRGPALAVGDIFGNGADALVVGGTTRDPLRVFALNKVESRTRRDAAMKPKDAPEGAIFKAVDLPDVAQLPPLDDGPVLLFDASGRGNADLLVTRGGASQAAQSPSYQPQLYLNDGHGHFVAGAADALPSLPISVGAVAAADFDRDGKLDVFIGGRCEPGLYPNTPRSALLSNQGGKFADVVTTVAPGLGEVGLVTAALWSDVDGDGWVDLLVATEWGEVRYFHNESGKRFEDWTTRAGFSAVGKGLWRSLSSGDFNGDGRPDFVAGNLGLNTPYRADTAHPATLFAGDLSGRGDVALIEARYDGERLVPLRSRRELASALPTLLRRYQKNDAFAQASLSEIVGAGKLDAVTKLTASELRSGVFLSQPDGTYRFEALPAFAQISPLNGVAVGDFDGDGKLDIYAVQNSYAPNPSLGRFDGGLSQLLLGDGHGHFETISPSRSGLIVPGDAKALVTLDVDDDGWADFLVSRNNASLLAFARSGADSREDKRGGSHPLRVRLRGRAGNPNALGARVTVTYADGSTATSEVSAGSGYYSQSSAALFFGYATANPARKLTIRWPDGAIETHELSDLATALDYSRP